MLGSQDPYRWLLEGIEASKLVERVSMCGRVSQTRIVDLRLAREENCCFHKTSVVLTAFEDLYISSRTPVLCGICINSQTLMEQRASGE